MQGVRKPTLVPDGGATGDSTALLAFIGTTHRKENLSKVIVCKLSFYKKLIQKPRLLSK